MRKHNWYFTIISTNASAIEYAVICVDEEFDRHIERMRDVWTRLHDELGDDSNPVVSVQFPHVSMVKTLPTSREEDVEESIDNASGMWAKLPLRPLHDLLYTSGQLERNAIFELLLESEVSGSKARLAMEKPDLVNLIIDPGDSSKYISTDYFNNDIIRSHSDTH
jgi:hypothetical protein